ncbi:hypothetical protein BDZ45DRAFT_691386 [Acephala macrosclerotiorum]|nr:hypothetical protein BDZ45DRAFT_691386 [Acephala macrosclerotiorum]
MITSTDGLTCGLRANVIQAHHDDHRITHIQSSPPNECSNPRETECEPSFNSAHSSEWYNASAVDSGVLHSTNTSWGFEEVGFDIYGSSAVVESPDAYHYDFGENFDLVLENSDGFLPVPELVENIPLNSTPELGNLESVSSVSDDHHTIPDGGSGHDDNQSFPFDDYINYESEYPTEVAMTSRNLQPSLVPDESLLPLLIDLTSPSPFEPRSSSEASRATGSLTSSKNSSPTSASKLALSPSSSFECSMCQTTSAFRSRLESHMATHNKFKCMFEGCSLTFTELRGRTRHIESVHERREYKTCEECGQGFTRKDKYDVHTRRLKTMESPIKQQERPNPVQFPSNTKRGDTS